MGTLSVSARIARLEDLIGVEACTCAEGTTVRLLSGHGMEQDFKTREGCARARILLTPTPPCPIHGPSRARIVNLTGEPEGVWHERMLQLLEAGEARFSE
jgi:hypothetical protein